MWLIVSNRLPFGWNAEAKKVTPSSGGLVTALRGIQSKEPKKWIGCLTDDIPKVALSEAQAKEKDIQLCPVYLKRPLYDSYYNDFCNDCLWPLFHYESEIVRFKQEAWKDYLEVNQIFAAKIVKEAKKGDLVWLHDFHLMMVPQFVKEKRPDLKVGFFLHIPWPSSEIFRQLPVRKEILKSLVCCDLVGFHDYGYLRHFSSSVYSLLGLHSEMLSIDRGDHVTSLGVFPVSIDTKSFVSRSQTKKTGEFMGQFETEKHMILGVDRLDYIKGIELKLLAFERLLEKFPDMQGKVKLLQIAVPSRVDVPDYKKLKENVEMLVGQINGRFGTPNYTPIQYMFKSINIYELLALYRLADVLLIASKRDGMNLVSLEYIASQPEEDPGVVILSEYAGAVSTLSHALTINPWDIENSANTLYLGLHYPLKDRLEAHQRMFSFLKSYTATHWAKSFMEHLGRESLRPQSKVRTLSKEKLKRYLNFGGKKHYYLFIDYDGTLVPIVQNPSDAILPRERKQLLKKLSEKENVTLVVVSGRPSQFLEEQLGTEDFFLASEHGGRFYSPIKGRWRSLVSMPKKVWFGQAGKIMRDYEMRTPGSFLEKKNLPWPGTIVMLDQILAYSRRGNW
jgi:trehalose 6-phosphate synthase/phosphatase